MHKLGICFIVSGLVLNACQRTPVAWTRFRSEILPPAPDYAQAANWAALPQRADAADRLPLKSPYRDGQDSARADVFFVHPTVYLGQPPANDAWNAELRDSVLNRTVDNSTILNQASVFNGSCRVYAPRYRQAHYAVFTTADTASARHALDLAYADVKAAFQHYLDHFSGGRPVVVAGHSQGTVHAVRLLQEFSTERRCKTGSSGRTWWASPCRRVRFAPSGPSSGPASRAPTPPGVRSRGASGPRRGFTRKG